MAEVMILGGRNYRLHHRAVDRGYIKVNDVKIDDYPLTKEWLLNFKEVLDKRNEGKHDIIPCGHPRKESVILEDNTSIQACRCYFLSVQCDGPGSRSLKTCQKSKKSRLTAAALSEDTYKLAIFDIKAYILKDKDICS